MSILGVALEPGSRKKLFSRANLGKFDVIIVQCERRSVSYVSRIGSFAASLRPLSIFLISYRLCFRFEKKFSLWLGRTSRTCRELYVMQEKRINFLDASVE